MEIPERGAAAAAIFFWFNRGVKEKEEAGDTATVDGDGAPSPIR